MDGLDTEEINFSNLENLFTIGAEYYGKNYVHTADVIKGMNHRTLHDISKRITDGDHGSADYQNDGVLYLLSESVQEGYIDISKCRFITANKNEELKRSELHPGDVVVTKTGVYFGKSAVIPNDISKANMIAHVGKIELKEGCNPYYVSTFLNSKYGYNQLRRRGIKATRPEIKLVELPGIMVPIFSESFEQKIESVILLANQILSCSLERTSQCESILIKKIGFDVEAIASTNYSVRQFRTSYCNSGRLDAEYYQPKYESLFKTLKGFNSESLGGENGLCSFKKSIEPGSDAYQDSGIPFVRVSDIDKYGIAQPQIYLSSDIVENVNELFLKEDTILLSKDGSVGVAYKVREDMEVITSGALLHLTVKDKSKILPDYLTLVLNSPIVQLQAERDTNGAIIQHWKPSEIENVLIPILDMDIQKEIAAKVQESFALRKKSKDLLEYAKQAVEMAIEQGEDVALEWLKSKEGEM